MNRSEPKHIPGRVFFLGIGYCVFVLTSWIALGSLDSGNGGFAFFSLLVALVIGFIGMKALDAYTYRRQIESGADEMKAKRTAAMATAVTFSVTGFIAAMVAVNSHSGAFTEPASVAAAPTSAPTPGPCDGRMLRRLDTAIGADILAGSPVSSDVSTAAQAEDACSRYLPQGDPSYRHIIAEGNDYLLGIHASDVNDRIGFMQYARAAVSILLMRGSPSDPSDAIRAQAQEITDTANSKLQLLGQ